MNREYIFSEIMLIPNVLVFSSKKTNQPSILRMRHLIQSYSDVIYDITDDVDDGSNNPKY